MRHWRSIKDDDGLFGNRPQMDPLTIKFFRVTVSSVKRKALRRKVKRCIDNRFGKCKCEVAQWVCLYMPNLIIVFICEPVNVYLCTFCALRIMIRKSASVWSRFFCWA